MVHTARIDTARLQLVVPITGCAAQSIAANYAVAMANCGCAGDAKNLFVPIPGLNLGTFSTAMPSWLGRNFRTARRSPDATDPDRRRTAWNCGGKDRPLAVAQPFGFSGKGDMILRISPHRWPTCGRSTVTSACSSPHPIPGGLAISCRLNSPARGRSDAQQPRWIKHLPAKHGEAASHRPAGSKWSTFDADFKSALAWATDFEYLLPLLLWRSGDNV